LLSTLGVDRETVLDDYELTTRYRSLYRIEELRPRLEAAGIDVEAVRPFLTAPRPGLASALADVDAWFGGVDRYLVEAAGVPLEALDALRRDLLESPR
jgi:protein-tyrosine phosphatase